VSDTGTGMTEEVQARLFEPFFTTKLNGKGTGLGLATCHTIAKQSGGFIGVYSELGKGSTLKVYFPCVEEPLSKTVEFLKSDPLPRGTETVLLVEDDTDLRQLGCKLLTKQGYKVLSAANGQEGLEAVRLYNESPIHLVVTDVVMPKMGGKVMAEALKETNPLLKILFTSGYTGDAITNNGLLEPGVEFLTKPYTPSQLTHKVRELLDTEIHRKQRAKVAEISLT